MQRESGLLPIDLPPVGGRWVVAAVEDLLLGERVECPKTLRSDIECACVSTIVPVSTPNSEGGARAAAHGPRQFMADSACMYACTNQPGTVCTRIHTVHLVAGVKNP